MMKAVLLATALISTSVMAHNDPQEDRQQAKETIKRLFSR